jgi:hypothetical protein
MTAWRIGVAAEVSSHDEQPEGGGCGVRDRSADRGSGRRTRPCLNDAPAVTRYQTARMVTSQTAHVCPAPGRVTPKERHHYVCRDHTDDSSRLHQRRGASRRAARRGAVSPPPGHVQARTPEHCVQNCQFGTGLGHAEKGAPAIQNGGTVHGFRRRVVTPCDRPSRLGLHAFVSLRGPATGRPRRRAHPARPLPLSVISGRLSIVGHARSTAQRHRTAVGARTRRFHRDLGRRANLPAIPAYHGWRWRAQGHEHHLDTEDPCALAGREHPQHPSRVHPRHTAVPGHAVTARRMRTAWSQPPRES